MVTVVHKTFVGGVLLVAAVGCVSQRGPRLAVPDTVSEEARQFLVQTKGDIINNYILQDGEFVLDRMYREAEPSLQVVEEKLGGVKAFWASSTKASVDAAVVVYFHGGGYVEGDGKLEAGTLLPVFEALGVRGLSVHYRLAPEHPFPAAVDDAVAVYRALLKKGYNPQQIALTGDSAGGGLALAATLSLRESGDPLPGAVAVISPGTLDMSRLGDTFLTLADCDPFLDLAAVTDNRKKYAGDTRLDHPLLSPLYSNFEGFPPLLIQVGTRELLLSDSARLARKARAAGVDVTLDVWEGMWHVWHMTWPLVPEAREACRVIADFLRPRILH